jgi:hypothetical protein
VRLTQVFVKLVGPEKLDRTCLPFVWKLLAQLIREYLKVSTPLWRNFKIGDSVSNFRTLGHGICIYTAQWQLVPRQLVPPTTCPPDNLSLQQLIKSRTYYT